MLTLVRATNQGYPSWSFLQQVIRREDCGREGQAPSCTAKNRLPTGPEHCENSGDYSKYKCFCLEDSRRCQRSQEVLLFTLSNDKGRVQ